MGDMKKMMKMMMLLDGDDDDKKGNNNNNNNNRGGANNGAQSRAPLFSQNGQRRVCFNFSDFGNCAKGQACTFAHEQGYVNGQPVGFFDDVERRCPEWEWERIHAD